MRRKITLIAAWAWLAFIALATLSPAHLRPELTTTEPAAIVVLEHVGAYALLGILFSASYRHRPAQIMIIVFGSAVLLELLQLAVPGRDARLVDAAEKLLGGGVGIAIAYLALRIGSRRKNSHPT